MFLVTSVGYVNKIALLKEYELAGLISFPIKDQYVIFSGELFFCPSTGYSFIHTRLFKNLKVMILKSTITWSVMGKQTAQVEQVCPMAVRRFQVCRSSQQLRKLRIITYILETRTNTCLHRSLPPN